MLTIACLLKAGGPDFNEKHVARLRKQCERIPHERFVCLSDVDVPCERIALLHKWPRWWGQCELFRPGLFSGPVIYMDLDTTVLADPGINIEPGDFWSLKCQRKGVPTSGIMGWWGDFSKIYEAAQTTDTDPYRWVNEGIFPHVRPKLLQDHLPGFYSYKDHVRGKQLPVDAAVIYFHGKPRPWRLPDDEPHKAVLQ